MKNDLENRLNQIRDKNIINTQNDKNNKEKEDDNKSLDFNSLKDKVKMDNAPELKEVKDLDKNIKSIKEGFSSASGGNAAIKKEKFLHFIKQANEMSQNYEKQLQYYSMYSGKYNTKDLTITESKDKSFYFFPDRKKAFSREVKQIKNQVIGNKGEEKELERIQKIYQEKNVYIRVSGPTGAYMRFTTRVIGNSKYTITNPAIYILKNNSNNIFETECIDIIGGRVGKTYQFRLFTTYPLSISFLGNTILFFSFCRMFNTFSNFCYFFLFSIGVFIF